MVEFVVKDNALYILCVKYIDYLYVVPQTTHMCLPSGTSSQCSTASSTRFLT